MGERKDVSVYTEEMSESKEQFRFGQLGPSLCRTMQQMDLATCRLHVVLFGEGAGRGRITVFVTMTPNNATIQSPLRGFHANSQLHENFD